MYIEQICSISPLSDSFNCIQESKMTTTEFMEKDEYFETDINIAYNVNEEEYPLYSRTNIL